ncbi:1-phosphofructokinase [Chloroflexia bacterium SDU3-3]|nr:1-phosphofructokinase [Chloroflexia bacterium SDU3-3]
MIYTLTLNPALDRELMVPALDLDQVLRATATQVDFGGKGFNVSRMLIALGSQSVALGFAGGHTGQQLRQGLAALEIATDFIAIGGETRTNISVVSSDHTRSLKVNEPGPTISPAEQTLLLNQVRRLARAGDWWVLAGSLPPGLPATMYADLITLLHQAGANTVLDTSGEALRHGCAAHPTLIKPNAEEVGQLLGRRIHTHADALSAAAAFAGIPYVVISLGAEGAVLSHQGRGWFAASPKVQARSPIGAGDSLVAGLTWGLSQGDILQGLRWGVACGAATAACPGTALGTAQQVADLAPQVIIREL